MKPRPFSPGDRVLLVRSAWIGDFLVCVPFLEQLLAAGLPKENLGFLILNGAAMNPVQGIFGRDAFRARVLAPTARAVLGDLPALRRLAKDYDRICYLPFQTESFASRAKKGLALGLALGRRIEGLHGTAPRGLRPSQALSLLDLYGLPFRRIDHLAFLDLSDAERAPVEAFLDGWKGPLRIALHAQAKLPRKVWPAENFAELIRVLRRRWGAQVCLVGGPEDRAANEALRSALSLSAEELPNLAGRFDLRQMVHLLSRLQLLVANDTSNLHLGALADLPLLGLYGCQAPPGQWDPLVASRMATLQARDLCGSCARFPDRRGCVARIPLDAVLHLVKDLLEGTLVSGAYRAGDRGAPPLRIPYPFNVDPDPGS